MGGNNDEYQKIMAYNMRIIQAMWKKYNGDYGKNRIHENKKNTKNLYASIEKSRQSIRDIKYMELANYNKERILDWANRVEQETGIPHEYLAGQEKIKLGSEFEKDWYEKYEQYVDECVFIDEQRNRNKENLIHLSEAKLKKLIKEKENKELEQYNELIERAKESLKRIKEFDDALDKEIDRLGKLIASGGNYNDEKLFRLVFFIQYNKKYSVIGIKTINDVVKVMKETRTKELKELGEQGLREYIKALRHQLTLAEAVYTVAVDCGNFKVNDT